MQYKCKCGINFCMGLDNISIYYIYNYYRAHSLELYTSYIILYGPMQCERNSSINCFMGSFITSVYPVYNYTMGPSIYIVYLVYNSVMGRADKTVQSMYKICMGPFIKMVYSIYYFIMGPVIRMVY